MEFRCKGGGVKNPEKSPGKNNMWTLIKSEITKNFKFNLLASNVNVTSKFASKVEIFLV